MDKKHSQIEGLATSAYRDFSDLLDYIWKTPRFIDAELNNEINKLTAYYPLTDDPIKDQMTIRDRGRRWSLEERKLFSVFPRVMASSNLLSAVSMYEFYCLKLCKKLEVMTGPQLASSRKKGIQRLWSFLEDHGKHYARAPFGAQISAAIKIRNCIIHANGNLSLMTNAEEIRYIVKTKQYLPKLNSDGRPCGVDPMVVSISSGDMGEQLEISNTYSFVTSSYLRDNFLSLCV